MINIALYKPDIPQNTGAIVRLAACLNLKIHIIEPCGFNLDDPRFKRVAMDYTRISKIIRYKNFNSFLKKNSKSRIILMTTKAKKFYHLFKFKKEDFLLFGRESSGVPDEVHKKIKHKLKIKLNKNARSLNIAMSVAIASSESLRQNYYLYENEN
tara:strand:+ start:942 stop:1406 length:465 start_codon:yes stop_codon:yes gene_type:complete